MDKDKDKLIELGNCRKPHGIKGSFSFVLINQMDSSLKKGSKVTLIPMNTQSILPTAGEEFEISSISFGNKTIVALKGVDNRNIVEAMIPFTIYIKRSSLPGLEDEDDYYLSDLVGLYAIDEKGEEVGVVTEIGTNGVQDILTVKTAQGIIEILLVDNFVKEIDWETKQIHIITPEMV